MSRPLRVLYRADGGHPIGTGHICRAGRVERALRRRGELEFTLVTAPDPGGWKMPDEAPKNVHFLPMRTDTVTIKPQFRAAPVLDLLSQGSYDIAVVDMLDTDRAEMEALSRLGKPIVTFDDRGEGRFFADLLINVLVEEPEPNRLDKTRLLEGTPYVTLAEEFGPEYPVPARRFGPVERIFCSLGGVDAAGLSAKVVRALKAVPGLRHVEFVMSNVEPQRSALVTELETAPFEWSAPFRVPSTRERFEWCDVAIVAGGLTMHEVCRMGCPSVAVCQPIDHQFELGERLMEAGAMLSVGYGTDATDQAVADAVLSLFQPEVRRTMSEAGIRLVDGLGSDRIAEAIEEAAALSRRI